MDFEWFGKNFVLVVLTNFFAASSHSYLDYSSTEVYGGSPALLAPTDVPIEFSSQEISIRMFKSSYTVECLYKFQNNSKDPNKIKIGFPKLSQRHGEGNEPHAQFQHIQVKVGQKELILKEEIAQVQKEPPNELETYWGIIEKGWLTADLQFGGSQKIFVRVHYRAPYTLSGDGPGCLRLRFDLGPAGSWAGPISQTMIHLIPDKGICVNQIEFPAFLPRFIRNEIENQFDFMAENIEPSEGHELVVWSDENYMQGECGLCYRKADCLEANVGVWEKPTLSSKSISILPRGAGVLVLNMDENDVEIDGKKDRWFHVLTSEGVQGWVFGGYLKLGEAPMPQDGEGAPE